MKISLTDDLLSSRAHSLARNVLTRCSPQPVVLMPTLYPFWSALDRWAQHPHPKQEAWPTRPGCLRAIPPELTVLATLPDESITTTPTVSVTASSRECRDT